MSEVSLDALLARARPEEREWNEAATSASAISSDTSGRGPFPSDDDMETRQTRMRKGGRETDSRCIF